VLERLLAKRHINHLDLSSVRACLIDKKSWTADQAKRVEGDYKRFLYALARKRQEDVISPPDQEVDEFWHQHILDTRKYRADCDTIFGHYVDHMPDLGPDEQRKADARRRQVYEEYDIDLIWFESPGGASEGGHGHGAGECNDSAVAHACDTGSGHSSGSADGGGSGDSGGGDGGGGDGGGGCGGGSCGGG
jgi:hypothetical protein